MGAETAGWDAFMRGLNATAMDMADGAHALVPAGAWPWPRDPRPGPRRDGPADACPGADTAIGTVRRAA